MQKSKHLAVQSISQFGPHIILITQRLVQLASSIVCVFIGVTSHFTFHLSYILKQSTAQFCWQAPVHLPEHLEGRQPTCIQHFVEQELKIPSIVLGVTIHFTNPSFQIVSKVSRTAIVQIHRL